jgi:hypothetical protein
MKQPQLTILIPTVTERFAKAQRLIGSLLSQPRSKDCEILWFGDNRKRTIGEKRDNLLRLAKGRYVAFCDDDDKVSGDYVQSLVEVAERESVDVISFRQSAVWDGQHSEVHFSIQHQNEPFNPGNITKRFPWHVCAWKREIARDGVFQHCQWGEDAAWVQQVAGLAKREAHIPRVLHYYEHGSGSLAK